MTLFEIIVLIILGTTWIGLAISPFFMRKLPEVVACETGTVSNVDIDFGDLQLRSTSGPYQSGKSVKVLVNGKELAATCVELRCAVGEIVTAKTTYYPRKENEQ